MILEHLEKLLRTEAENRPPNNPFRASAMGRCIREGCFDLLGLKGEPMQPRRMLTLHHGTAIHDALLTPLIKKAMGWRVVDGKDLGDNWVEIDGVKIGYHIDLAFQHETPAWEGLPGSLMSIGVAEIKGWTDITFDKAARGEIDREVHAQAWVYHEATAFNPVVFLGFKKKTSHMVEIVFDRNQREQVVTQTLTGDPILLAKEDPILLTEIVSPFDPSVEKYVRERIKWLKATRDNCFGGLDTIKAVIPGADAVEDEVEKIQGQKAAANYMQKYPEAKGLPERNGSWYSFKTGRKILGFPCSYCSHKARCYPTAAMEMKGDRPVFVIP